MRVSLFLLAGTLALAGCEQQPEGKPVARAKIDGDKVVAVGGETAQQDAPAPSIATQVESPCRSVIFENTSLTHCLAVPSRHRITMRLARRNGENIRSLDNLSEEVSVGSVAFAVNGGMFDDAGDPVGYYVENSQRLQTLNTADGEGNFHMKPNGVFFGSDGSWEIRTSEDFLANVSDRPQFGTQSGPMLVVGGKLHPDIARDGESRLVRNGVGVDTQGRAHFVISNAPVSFGKLARFFKDELDTPNALFLDGNVSALWVPATGRVDTGNALGPFIVVEKKQDETE